MPAPWTRTQVSYPGTHEPLVYFTWLQQLIADKAFYHTIELESNDQEIQHQYDLGFTGLIIDSSKLTKNSNETRMYMMIRKGPSLVSWLIYRFIVYTLANFKQSQSYVKISEH